ncbi:hypothetical protein HN51_061443 [Arachis hypogaea]|uniref:Oleosin n=1 Tax=Arachis hypogaea TaxID=3818 RepID=A0A445AN82_ARAHY|nr:P24 oleosin [Arachis ipaensis]XP_025630985.1 P24 oleosin [Arachis hypogaea]QHO18687.1 Oleosin [Arachis hypogaea]RYR27902.1 hypothetical protein Ahy_B01g051979 [Arachis hypogaea]
MAERYHNHSHQDSSERISRSMVVTSVIGAIAVGAPLLGMMGFGLLASSTLLLVSSPLLLLFSPVILGATFVILGAVAGFSVASVMAVVGIAAVSWVVREARLKFRDMKKVVGNNPSPRMKGKELDYFDSHLATTSNAK